MTRDEMEAWLASYRKAWASDDPADIGALFTDNATYSPWPYATPWKGRDQIVGKWIERGDSQRPWTFEHSIVAIDGDLAVVEGTTGYPAFGDDAETEYKNLWIVRLEADGRASEFAEWWVEREHAES